MKIIPTLVVCARCDTVYRRPVLATSQVAVCATCGIVIARPTPPSIDAWLALTLSAAILFVLANAFPVISLGVQNFRINVTLWQATTSLIEGVWAPLAVPVAMFALVIPLAQITLLGWILMFARQGKSAPGFRQVMKVLAAVQPWSMMDVAMLSMIVAGIKLSSMAHVSLGAGTWAMLALTCLAAFTTKRDVQWLWRMSETPVLASHGKVTAP